MKYFVLLILLMMVSCGANNQKRNAELTVTYEKEVVHRAGGKWLNEAALKDLLENQTGPIRVIFSSSYCPPCSRLEEILNTRDLNKHVVWVNAEDKWVKQLARSMSIRIYPTMIVSKPKGGDLRFDGIKEIVFHLVYLRP